MMEQRPFGLTNREVGVIGQGTWNVERDDRATVVAALRRGLDLGMNHIDTAEMYGDGISEEIVGYAIHGRRDDVFLVSKVVPSNASLKGTLRACDASLTRLRTDHLDCYLLHWRGEHPLEETFAAFEQLQRAGKIRSWGVSNFDVADLQEAWPLVGPAGLVCNQILYHLQERAIEHAVLPWCEAHGVAVTAYSPLGHGRFPERGEPGWQVLARIAEAHGATPRQVALRFVVRRPLLFAIPKSSTPAHTAENAAAGDLQLTYAEIAEIDAAFPAGPPKRRLPML
jgi:diketogulonate reductase-like aldo/keto reductase